jgi:hypothetical protein
MGNPTLAELVDEPLTQKHRRLMQGRCRHPAVLSSTFCSPDGTFTDDICLDCGRHTRIDHGKPTLSMGA